MPPPSFYADRQTVDPAVVKTAVLFFLAPLLAGAILWVAVGAIPDACRLVRTLVVYRPAVATVLEHKHVLRSYPSPDGIAPPVEYWQPGLLLRYRVGSVEVESWSHDPFNQWLDENQLAAVAARYPTGRSCRCYYDVTSTHRVALSRDVPLTVVASIVTPLFTLAITGGLMWLAWPLMFYRPRVKSYGEPEDWTKAGK